MVEIFRTPELDAHDRTVIGEINGMKRELATHLRATPRWHGGLRRSAQARAVFRLLLRRAVKALRSCGSIFAGFFSQS